MKRNPTALNNFVAQVAIIRKKLLLSLRGGNKTSKLLGKNVMPAEAISQVNSWTRDCFG